MLFVQATSRSRNLWVELILRRFGFGKAWLRQDDGNIVSHNKLLCSDLEQ